MIDFLGFYKRIEASNSHDPEKCDMIREASKKHLQSSFQALSYEEVSQFFQWVSFYFSCLGAETSAWDSFACLKEAGLKELSEKKHEAITRFFSHITKQMRIFREPRDSHKQASVVVLTTLSCASIGGYDAPNRPRGHYSPAVAIMKNLQENRISAALLDIADGEECDPDRFPIIDLQTRYARLRKAVMQYNPKLIISSICHDNEDLALRFDLDIPLMEIQTDYSIYRGFSRIHAPFTKEGEHAQFFEMARFGSKIQQLILADSDGLGRRIESVIGEVYSQIVHPYIFPTRPSFVRQSDPISLSELRERLGIRPDEQVVLITSGFIEGEDMTKLVPRLNETKLSFSRPLYVVIICGENKNSRDFLGRYLAENPHHPQMRFKLEGRLEEREMAQYGQVAAWDNGSVHGCMVGKAGGSTVSENLVLGLYTLMLPSGGCEEEAANRIHMKECLLGETLESKESFVSQLKSALERTHPHPAPIEAWNHCFMRRISEMIE